MDADKAGLALHKFLNPRFLLLFAGAGLHLQPAYAFDWQVRPNLTMNEIFDDNLNLSNTAKKSGFASEVTPGLNLRGQSAWSNFNLNYRLQGLYNAQGSDAVDIHHQLQMNSLYQAVPNTLFLETSSSMTQQNINNALIATDNVAGRGGTTESRNFNISPYFTPHFGQYASGLLKAGYGRSFFNNPSTAPLLTPQLTNLLTDSETISKQARLSSGTYFNVVSWGLNYSAQDQKMIGGQDVRFESYTADGRYYLNRSYNLFAQTGYENNNYQTQLNTATPNNNNIKNGFFYTVGAQWKPSLWYSLEAGYGNNSHVTLQYNPSTNLSSHITYNHKNVGLNLGSSWDAALNYSTMMAHWGLTYHQDTQTVQQILASQNIFTTNAFGNLTPVTDNLLTQSQSRQYILNLPTLVNDVLISKTANISFSYQSGKSTYNAFVYNTRRTYQLSQEEDTLYGASAGWQWQFIPRTTLYLQPLWQSTKSNLNAANSDLYEVSVGVTRPIPIYLGRPLQLNTTLDMRHIEQVSKSTAGFGYTENRATAGFFVQF